MPTEELNRNLQELHRRLEGTVSIDPATRESLKELLKDIERLLETSPPAKPSSVVAELESHFLQLSEEHPALAAGIRQLVDGLNSLGI